MVCLAFRLEATPGLVVLAVTLAASPSSLVKVSVISCQISVCKADLGISNRVYVGVADSVNVDGCG